LRETINRGRTSYLKALRILAETLIPHIEHFSAANNEIEFSEASVHLIEILESQAEIQFLTNNELIILQKVFEVMPPMSLDFANNDNFMNQADLSYQLNN